MKKFLLIIFTCLSFSFYGNQGFDQHQKNLQVYCTLYANSMEFCKENGYNFFKFLSYSYKDSSDEVLNFKGICKDCDGEIFKKSLSEEVLQIFGLKEANYEIVCFKDAPKDEQICDVDKYYKLIEAFQNQEVAVVGETNVKEINSIHELQEVIKSSKETIYIDCYSTRCPPCKMLSPKFDQYSKDLKAGKFLKVNVDDVKELVDEYQIEGFPTLLVFQNGKIKVRKLGLPDILQYFESEREALNHNNGRDKNV